jgi:hypothetical protein
MAKHTVVTYVQGNGNHAKTAVTQQQLAALQKSGRLVANHGDGTRKK